MGIAAGDSRDGGSAAHPLGLDGQALILVVAALLLGAGVGGLLAGAGVGAWVGLLVAVPFASLLFVGRARLVATLGCAACAAALAWAHPRYFTPLFAYQGLVDGNPQLDATLVVVALAALPATWLPLAADRPSTVVVWFLYLAGYLPAVVMPLLLTGDLEATLPAQLALLASMALLGLFVRLPPARVAVPGLSPTDFTRLLVGFAALSTLFVVASFGIRSLPTLEEVYGTRSQFKDVVGQVPGAGYVIPWAGNVINPLLLALGLSRRRADLVALALVGQLAIYANTGYKNVLFSIVLVPLVHLAISRGRRWFGLGVALAAPVTLLGAVLAGPLTSGWSITLIRRVFAVPGQVDWYYFDYFSSHAPYQLSHSFLGWLVPPAYSVDPPVLIGRAFFPGANPNANASFWADAFANFGFLGIVGFTLVLGALLWLADEVARGRDLRVLGPALAIIGLALAEGALFTTVLTFGLGLALVLTALMPPGERLGRGP